MEWPSLDVTQIGLAPFIERRWHADQHGIHVAEAFEIGSGAESLVLHVLAIFPAGMCWI